jgi:hypothetical protein
MAEERIWGHHARQNTRLGWGYPKCAVGDITQCRDLQLQLSVIGRGKHERVKMGLSSDCYLLREVDCTSDFYPRR